MWMSSSKAEGIVKVAKNIKQHKICAQVTIKYQWHDTSYNTLLVLHVM